MAFWRSPSGKPARGRFSMDQSAWMRSRPTNFEPYVGDGFDQHPLQIETFSSVSLDDRRKLPGADVGGLEEFGRDKKQSYPSRGEVGLDLFFPFSAGFDFLIRPGAEGLFPVNTDLQRFLEALQPLLILMAITDENCTASHACLPLSNGKRAGQRPSNRLGTRRRTRRARRSFGCVWELMLLDAFGSTCEIVHICRANMAGATSQYSVACATTGATLENPGGSRRKMARHGR